MQHRVTVLDLLRREQDALPHGVVRATEAIVGAFDSDGLAAWQNNGIPAHQSVPHVHFHAAGTLPGAGQIAFTSSDSTSHRPIPSRGSSTHSSESAHHIPDRRLCGACAAEKTIVTSVAHDEGEVDDDKALGAYGGIVEVAAHVPTLTGAIMAAIAAGLVWTWRWAWRRRRHA